MRLLWALVLFSLFGFDLDPGYAWHLVRGQARLLWCQTPIRRVLKRKDLDPLVRRRLEFVQEVRAFAEARIGLAGSKNYTTFCDIGEGPVSWNLTACPKDRLEPVTWNYPVVGRAPYRGYFDRERAEAERDRLSEAGYDTYLRPVSAYSTLGWFTDPILSPMLRYSDGDLAGLILHELTHATVWIPGGVAFNESLATFVGDTGSIAFLEDRYGAGAPEVQSVLDARADGAVFRRFMHGIAQELEAVYSSDRTPEEKLKAREAVFEGAKARFAGLPLKTDRYTFFPGWRLNNAVMSAYRTYHEGLDVFERVYEATGRDLRASVGVFRACEEAERPRAFLEAWLEERR